MTDPPKEQYNVVKLDDILHPLFVDFLGVGYPRNNSKETKVSQSCHGGDSGRNGRNAAEDSLVSTILSQSLSAALLPMLVTMKYLT